MPSTCPSTHGSMPISRGVKATIYSDIREIYLDKRLDTRNLELTVRYNFNPAKSKYRGQGAGNDTKGRFK